MESEDSNEDDDLSYSNDDGNPITVSEAHKEPNIQPANSPKPKSPEKLSPRSKVSNVESATPVSLHNYSPNKEIEVESFEPVTPVATHPRRYPSRNRTAVKRLDLSHSSE